MNTVPWKTVQKQWRTTRNLSPSACYRDQLLFTMKTQTKALYLENSFTDRHGIDILYYPEERDDKGELIKAGHYTLLRRAALLSQP